MSKYYIENKEYFDQLESVTFVHRNEYVMLVYTEHRNRPFKESQDYKKDILDKQQHFSQDNRQGSFYKKSEEPRKARKYVIFNAEGNIVFQYGGVDFPLEVNKPG